jgi:hypothetical protein
MCPQQRRWLNAVAAVIATKQLQEALRGNAFV